MNCKEFKKLLPDYLDKKLSEKQINEVQNHIDFCTECDNFLHKIENTLELLKPKAEITEHAFYFTRLKQKMESKNSPKESLLLRIITKKTVQPVIYLASLIIAVYIGILIGSGSTNQNQFSEIKNENINYIQTFADYQYLNDFKIEPIENLFVDDTGNVE